MNLLKKILVKILIAESKLIVKKYKPFIVAVTGSVGKTSTKDAIYSVLKDQSRYVRKSEKSMNSEIGLPLTIIGVPNAWKSIGGWLNNVNEGLSLIFKKRDYPDCLILEIGADHPGDISSVAKWLKPDVSVITKVSKTPVHVEFFSSPEQVFEEKASLAEAVRDGGSLVLFADDDNVIGIKDRVSARNVNVISYGTKASMVNGSNLMIEYGMNGETKYPIGIKFDIEMKGSKSSIVMNGVIGNTYQYPILAAAAVGLAKGMSIEKIVKNLGSYSAPRGRMNLLAGRDGSTIIDDTYNSSPDATVSALRSLKTIESSGVKIAILGDMMELGKFSADEHKGIGREVVTVANILITVGQRSRATADEAIRSGMDSRKVFSYDSAADLVSRGLPVVGSGDIILVKGSQSVRMERVVKALLRDGSSAEKTLVRQEKEWLDKA
ncbi:MAG: Mur ligase family protein [Candidatus Taylorbacteria bacterium]